MTDDHRDLLQMLTSMQTARRRFWTEPTARE